MKFAGAAHIGGRQALDFVDAMPTPTWRGSIARLYRIFLFFFRHPFSQRDELFTMRAASQFEKALHQPKSKNRGLIALQRCKLGWHRDGIHC